MRSDFSSMLSALRRERGISQKKAAGDLEISQALLSHYENGVREPKFEFVDKVCAYYGVSADYILGRQQPNTVPVPCGSEYSGEVAETALEIVKFMDAVENNAVKKVMSDYISFTAERMKRIISEPGTGEAPEMAALEGLYISAIIRAARNESTEEIENTIKTLRELII